MDVYPNRNFYIITGNRESTETSNDAVSMGYYNQWQGKIREIINVIMRNRNFGKINVMFELVIFSCY